MTYRLEFEKRADKEWKKLAPDIRKQFCKKLVERLDNPCVSKDRMSDMPNCYKIKLKTSGYRLVYTIIESKIVVQVISIGRREREEVYKNAKNRI